MTIELIQKYQQNPTLENEQAALASHQGFIDAQAKKWKGILPDVVIDAKAKHFAIQAFKTFDPTKANINTHLYNNISQLSRLIYTHQNASQIPEHQIQLISTVNQAHDHLKDKLDRSPSIHEIADHLSLPQAHIERTLGNQRSDLLYDSDHDDLNMPTSEISNTMQRLHALRNTLKPIEKKQIDDIIGLNKDPLSPQDFGKKYNMKPYQVSRLKEHFAKQIKD